MRFSNAIASSTSLVDSYQTNRVILYLFVKPGKIFDTVIAKVLPGTYEITIETKWSKFPKLINGSITKKLDKGMVYAIGQEVVKVYKADDLKGKKIVVLTNLEPRKLRGILSEGMLLAAVEGDNVSILMPDKDLPPGAKIE